ncbi:hypothetical protein B0H12DRAFT_754424 [Mycena haematopus]|nr:hypothetical protein B0H12DRAFT_754424 [Mycena haematopus]
MRSIPDPGMPPSDVSFAFLTKLLVQKTKKRLLVGLCIVTRYEEDDPRRGRLRGPVPSGQIKMRVLSMATKDAAGRLWSLRPDIRPGEEAGDATIGASEVGRLVYCWTGREWCVSSSSPSLPPPFVVLAICFDLGCLFRILHTFTLAPFMHIYSLPLSTAVLPSNTIRSVSPVFVPLSIAFFFFASASLPRIPSLFFFINTCFALL